MQATYRKRTTGHAWCWSAVAPTMNFIANRDDQCAQCCIGMLADKDLAEVERDMGGARPDLDFEGTLRQLEAYGIEVTVHRQADGTIDFDRHRVTSLSDYGEDATLLCRVVVLPRSGEKLTPRGHLVVIDKGHLYDPSLDRAYPLLEGLKQWEALPDECVLFNTAFEVRRA